MNHLIDEDILLRIQDWFEDKVILLVLIGLASRPVADFLLFTKILLGEIFKLNEDSLIITLLSWIWFIVFGYFQDFHLSGPELHWARAHRRFLWKLTTRLVRYFPLFGNPTYKQICSSKRLRRI